MALGLCVVLAVAGTLTFHQLGAASLFGDESIYAETSRESVERGTWLPLYKATGQLFPNKPPAKILLVTACFRWLGESEFSARLPDAMFGLLTVAGVYLFTAARFGIGTGLLAAAILLSAEGYLCEHGIRESVMDAMLTFIAFALCAAWVRFRELQTPRARWWAVAVCSVVLANVTKNMLGVVFAVVVAAVEAAHSVIARRRTTALLPALGLIAAAVAGGLAYFGAMMLVTRGEFAAFLREDILQRATSGVDPIHLEGPLFYLRSIGADFEWWLLLLVPAVWSLRRSRWGAEVGAIAFLALWSLATVGGFSVSVSKLPWYVYPAYPQLAVVMAFGALEVFRRLRSRALRVVAVVLAAGAAALGLGSTWQAVQADTLVIDEQRFVRAYSELESAALAVDASSIRRHGRLRSWTRFYLEGAPRSSWIERGRASFADTDAECLFIATGEPEIYPPTAATPWRTLARLRNADALAGPVWIVGTCDLDLPWAVDRGLDFHVHLLYASGFESGGFEGWVSEQRAGLDPPSDAGASARP